MEERPKPVIPRKIDVPFTFVDPNALMWSFRDLYSAICAKNKDHGPDYFPSFGSEYEHLAAEAIAARDDRNTKKYKYQFGESMRNIIYQFSPSYPYGLGLNLWLSDMFITDDVSDECAHALEEMFCSLCKKMDIVSTFVDGALDDVGNRDRMVYAAYIYMQEFCRVMNPE